jgi:hypothetical protein
MTRDEFKTKVDAELRGVFQAARQRDELSFLFAILGINSGMEDVGWQPINETQALTADLIGLINGPLHHHAKARMALLLYCHITEANFLYHCLYNMLLAAEGHPPKVFNFLDKYKNGVPPSVSAKLTEIKAKAAAQKFEGINAIFSEVIRPDIRNAFFHSDYILFENELRLKHPGSQYARIPLQEVFELVQKTVEFFNGFMGLLNESRRSFPAGYKITGRRAPKGQPLSSVEVLVDERGFATGFQSSDPLPIWWPDAEEVP